MRCERPVRDRRAEAGRELLRTGVVLDDVRIIGAPVGQDGERDVDATLQVDLRRRVVVALVEVTARACRGELDLGWQYIRLMRRFGLVSLRHDEPASKLERVA